jgi:hypothetical protein
MRLRRERPEVEAAESRVRQCVRARKAARREAVRIGKWLTLEEADYLLAKPLTCFENEGHMEGRWDSQKLGSTSSAPPKFEKDK